jgi:hypothetical protein
VYEAFADNVPPPQLASYTINESTGTIESANTYLDMPSPGYNQFVCCGMDMSPSGKLLAVTGSPGLQIFHFNGSAPITTYSSVLLPTVTIDQLAWDKSDHLFALSNLTEELYVFTITPSSIHEVAGSPFKIENAQGVGQLIVVPKL